MKAKPLTSELIQGHITLLNVILAQVTSQKDNNRGLIFLQEVSFLEIRDFHKKFRNTVKHRLFGTKHLILLGVTNCVPKLLFEITC